MTAAAPDPRFAQPEVLFFGLGAQKCGTTWLHQYLTNHAEACMPRRPFKELHYWNHLDGDIEARMLSLGRIARSDRKISTLARVQLRMLRHRDAAHTSYANVMLKGFDGHRIAGEITPDYAQLSEARLAEMAALHPDTRFVFLMRDPVERLHSALRKRIRARQGGDRDMALTGDDVLGEFNALIKDGNMMPLRRSRYETTITRLESVTDSGKIGLFFYEDIFGNRDIGPVCDFLSISRQPGDFTRVANPGNPVADDHMDAFRAAARPHLASTYDFMERRFGDALPKAWQQERVLH